MLFSWLFGVAAALAQQSAIHAGAEAPLVPRSGPSVGLSLGAATGVGPTLGAPIRHWALVRRAAHPAADRSPRRGRGWLVRAAVSAVHRQQSTIEDVPGAQGASATGLGLDWLWGAGVGAGVEVRKDTTTGFTQWVDVTVTALGTGEGPLLVLPLPQAGVAWVF